MSYKMIGSTAKGNKHSENEDYIINRKIKTNSETGNVYIIGVTDGISTHSYGGSVARWVSNQLLTENFIKENNQNFPNQLENFINGLENKFKYYAINTKLEGLIESGCTISIVGTYGNYASCFWAGDSPIYHSKFNGKYSTKLISKSDIKIGNLTNFFGVNHFNLNFEQIKLNKNDIITILSDGCEYTQEKALNEYFENKDFNNYIAEEIVKDSTLPRYSDDSSFVAIKKI